MRLPGLRPRLYATAAAAGVLFAGCSGGSSPATSGNALPDTASWRAAPYRPALQRDGSLSVWPAGFTPSRTRPAWMRVAPNAASASRAGLAAAQFGASSVLWFPLHNRKNAAPSTCEPAQSTNGIRIDRDGNLWVPNGVANTTTEYAPHCGAAKLTIPDATGEPADVAFDKKNDVYIMNLSNHSGPPTVQVYNASGKKLRTLSQATFKTLFGVGSDRNGNIFVSNQQSNNVGNIVEFPNGKMPGKVLSSISLGLPGVPVFDASNNLVITDWEAMTIDVFAPPYTGQPTTFPLMGAAIWCPLGPGEHRLYCGDAENGAIDVYAYPKGTYLYSYTSSLSASALVTGVATDPTPRYW